VKSAGCIVAILGTALVAASASARAEFVPGRYSRVDPRRLAAVVPGEEEEGVMVPAPGQPLEWYGLYLAGPRVVASASRPSRRGYTSLLSWLDYDPATRNQGSCGNCWAWAGIACLAIDLSRQMGITDRLSVQHLNSCYDGDYACCGGWAADVAGFYNDVGYALPWSNANAAYADGASACADAASGLDCSLIGVSPSYPVDSMGTSYISTYGETQADAIANIKAEIDSGVAVWYSFYMPDSADRSTFHSFWRNQTEGEYIDMAYVDGHAWDPSSGVGHAVCCVGYDDTDPANPVWIMLNSWGTRTGRPNGLFLIAMDTDYSSSMTYYGIPVPTALWAVFDVVYPAATTTATTTTTTTAGDGSETPGDYNGDGTAELALFRASTGSWLLRGLTTAAFGVSTDIPAPADYDGDGAWDMAVWRPGTGRWMVSGTTACFYGVEGDDPAPADYDGDGTADAAIFRPGSGKWFLRGVSKFSWGAASDLPVPGDYDGDGTDDACVFRPGTGKWFARGVTRVSYGVSTDLPAAADYDGDGTDDVAVFRGARGKWFVRNLTQVSYGVATDLPAPADYDGDGTAEPALFRSAKGKWFVRGITSALFGASGDVPAVTRY